MPTYTQENRPIAITTPLGKDVLLLTGFRGEEAISQLFRFRLELLAEKQNKVPFDGIVGQDVTVELRLPGGGKRYFNGLVHRFTQGGRDATFTSFRADIVPRLWLLTKQAQSRIFQHLSVPDILKKVLTGLAVKYEIAGTYDPRDYCVQYRESDFAFASRLMEEEGIYYYFKHSNGSHQMVVTDSADQHPDVPGPTNAIYDVVVGSVRDESRVREWEKTQELRSGKYTLWDHCFELPGKNLEAKQTILDSVTVGQVTHKLKLGVNAPLEVYDYPGGYAQRFDGIDKSGGERPQDLEKIFKDNLRTVKLRMEQEEVPGLEIQGISDCGHFVPGHKFSLTRHFDADGPYLLTRVEHSARLPGGYQSAEEPGFDYSNRFSCIPAGLPYRTARRTPRPSIPSTQTATVVGPPGEEIFVDKYGRVKVQFHWDRDGKKNVDSSCWVRVAQPWAGKRWGAFFWPRIGNEVVVVFEEGDPDQPLIVGSVYNAENMPPFTLPKQDMLSGVKSVSVRGKAHENFNGIVFVDEKGHEHLAIHSERNMSLTSEFDKSFIAGRHKGERVASASVLTVGNIPGGGGSGGGPWKPPLQGVGGLNSIMVYGENLQVAVGLNHQLALGSNLQICINPAGLAAGVPGFAAPPQVSGFLGGGLGGNMQLTIGTSANFVLGRSFDINLGPPKIEVKDGKSHIASFILCGILGAVALAWVILYAVLEDDHDRAKESLAFQITFDLLLMALMIVETNLKKADMLSEIAEKKPWTKEGYEEQMEMQKMFGSGPDDTLKDYCLGLGVGAAWIGAFPLPLVAIAAEDASPSGFAEK